MAETDETLSKTIIDLVRSIVRDEIKKEKETKTEDERETFYDFTTGRISHEDMLWNPAFAHFNRVSLEKSTIVDRLRVTISPNGVGPEHSGCQGRLRFSKDRRQYEVASCEYRLMFQDNYNFAKGGKLPGLAGGVSINKIPPSGGLSIPGFSARIMFRENGKAYLYLYHKHQKNKYGDYFDLNQSFVPGAIHSVQQKIDIKNGIISVKIDGFECLWLRDFDLGYTDGARIDQLLFSVFHGGSDPALWAPKKPQNIYFYSVGLKGHFP